MKILDTTLRDGSYAINFQFTASDTAILCSQLEAAGFELIEVGHGVGLGASRAGMGEAAESDEGYLEAAAGSLSKAKFGMFCIPGIATLEDVDLAAEYGMGFLRVGTEVSRVRESKPFVERAKRYSMFVSSNLMKSYALPPKEFAKNACLTQEYGADVLTVVDSAGGMLSGELEAYFHAVREVCDIPLAFHGHDNLGLAVSNSLRALELGAVIVDGSLQGMGRSAGNAPTEMLVCVAKRVGYKIEMDPLVVMDIGAKYIRPLMRRQGLNSLDIVTGYAQFHSSFMGIIRQAASKHRIDPRKLIIEVCAIDKVNAPADMVDRVAAQISSRGDDVFSARFDLDAYYGAEQSPALPTKKAA